jgi:hypothetical protein
MCCNYPFSSLITPLIDKGPHMRQLEIADEIDKYLEENVSDESILSLLKLCLGRVLKRLGVGWKEDVNRDDLRHICDWLSAALLNQSPWLTRVDELGRPKKLMKFSTVKGILAEADKAMLAFVQKQGNLKLTEGEETVWLDLENGYVLVRLLTPTSLDRESSVMQHCIGGGGYDQYLENGERLFLSLRDAYGKAHATAEVRVSDGHILQLQGKQNELPDRRYLSAMRIAFLRPDFNPSEIMNRLEFVLSSSGQMLDKYDLPPQVEIIGDISFHWPKEGFVLPSHLTVFGAFKLIGYRHSTLPRGLTVHGNFELVDTDIDSLPADLNILGNIDITGPLKEFPDDFTAPANLRLRSAKFSCFPNNLTVVGSLHLEDCIFPYLPASLKVGGETLFSECSIAWVGKLSFPSDLCFSKCNIHGICEGVTIGGDFDLSRSSLIQIPDVLTVRGSLRMHFSKIAEIPMNWTVEGSIEAAGSSLTALPGREIVHGHLYLENTKIGKLDCLCAVGGGFNIAHTQISKLPVGLTISGDLDATGSNLDGLPEKLSVGGRLLLSASKITALPQGLSVNGACDLSNTPITEIPEGFSCGRYLDVRSTGVKKIPSGTTIDQLMCDDTVVEIGEDVAIKNGIVRPHVPEILSVDQMRERLNSKKAA